MSQSTSPLQTAPQQRNFAYSVTPADLEANKIDILRVCARGNLQLFDRKYEWGYQKNPLGEASCWVAVTKDDNAIVGTTALFPRRLRINGILYLAAVAGDFAVDPAHRAFWPSFLLQKAAVASCKAGNFTLLYGSPNQLSQPVQLRAGYKPIGFFRAGVKLLRSKQAFQSNRFTAWLSAFSESIDFLLTFLSRERLYRTSADYAFESPERFDERFDRFWQKVLPRFAVISERNSTFMNWRFASPPHKDYSIFAATERKTGEVAGYIVWWVKAGKVRISDVLVSDTKVLDSLLPEFVRLQRNRNACCITIIYLGDQDLIRKFLEFGFFFRRTASKVLVYTSPSFPHLQTLFNPANWHLLDGDSDS